MSLDLMNKYVNNAPAAPHQPPAVPQQPQQPQKTSRRKSRSNWDTLHTAVHDGQTVLLRKLKSKRKNKIILCWTGLSGKGENATLTDAQANSLRGAPDSAFIHMARSLGAPTPAPAVPQQPAQPAQPSCCPSTACTASCCPSTACTASCCPSTACTACTACTASC